MKRKNILFLILAVALLVIMLTSCNSGVDVFKIDFVVDDQVVHTIDTKGNEEIKLPLDPIKKGFIFEGWFLDKDTWQKPLTADSFLEASLSENMSVYAKWNEVVETTYTITFNSNGGSDVTAITKEAGESITAPSAPTKTGYTFAGWYTDNETFLNEYSFKTMPENTFTVYAKWIVNTYTVTFNSNGGIDVTAITKEAGDIITAPTAPTKTGYTFGGWYTDNGTFLNTYNFNTMPENTFTVYAKWIVNTYTVTFNSNGGNDVTAINKEFGESITEPTEPTKKNHFFDGWYTDGDTLADTYIFSTMPERDIILYAKWTERQATQGLRYTLIDNDTAYTVSGIGTATDKDIYISSSYNGLPVTSINTYAFSSCSELTSITMSDSLTSIKQRAFSGCSGVTSIAISVSVTSIGSNAFNGCSGLTSIIIPDGVISINDSAFYGCSGLMSITIGGRVTSIGNSAFYGCSGLMSITIGGRVTSIGNFAFYGCSGFISITIPDNVTSIGFDAFKDCIKLTSVQIGTGVTGINENTFSGCIELTSITIPNSVNSILIGAFYDCSGLKSIIIPNSVTSMGTHIFYNCSGLLSVEISSSLTKINENAFSGCSGLTSITIPDGVTDIGDSAFSGCRGLTSITIPDSVTSIGSHVFSGCRGLVSMEIPFVGSSSSAVAASASTLFGYIFGTSVYTGGIETEQYYSGDSVTYYIPTSLKSVIITGGNILYGAFSGCSGLTSIIIGNSVTSISDYMFSDCSGLTSITIPDCVTSIGYYSFYNCSGLTSIIISDSVTGIVSSAFYGCSGLTNVFYCGSDETAWSSITIGAENSSLTDTPRFYFSETENLDHWRYVEGIPTVW